MVNLQQTMQFVNIILAAGAEQSVVNKASSQWKPWKAKGVLSHFNHHRHYYHHQTFLKWPKQLKLLQGPLYWRSG